MLRPENLTSYDSAEDLTSEEAAAIFMREALKTGDAVYIAHALALVDRLKHADQS